MAADELPDLHPKWKVWFEHDGRYVFGRGAYLLLVAIRDTKSLTHAARRVGMSYRYAWGIIRRVEKELGVSIVETHRGGAVGGGETRITPAGLHLLQAFAAMEEAFRQTASRIELISVEE